MTALDLGREDGIPGVCESQLDGIGEPADIAAATRNVAPASDDTPWDTETVAYNQERASCTHSWQRVPSLERGHDGPHVFECAYCGVYGWRKRFRAKANAPVDPIRVYCGKRQEIMRGRIRPLEPGRWTAKPMSARRARNGGFVPPGAGGR